MSPLDPEIPPVGEEIHLPGPTLLPFLLAIGITLIIVGLTLGLFLICVGAALSIAVTIRWIADTRRDVNELPVEHGHHEI